MKKVKIHQTEEGYKYELLLPEELASWDVWDYWERERLDSMALNIKKGDGLMYVGAESGWMAALVSKYITDNVFLIEPAVGFWRCIKDIYTENGMEMPMGFQGFAGDVSKNVKKGFDIKIGDKLVVKHEYKSLSNPNHQLPVIKLDDIDFDCRFISIDVEGAELLVLLGAEKLLAKDVIVYVSVHRDLALKDYLYNVDELFEYMKRLGFKARLLERVHEEHWVFYRKNLIIKKNSMQVNFNNKEKISVTKKSIDKFVEKVRNEISGNSEHFWLEYKKGKKVMDKKWLRTEWSDEDLVRDVEAFIAEGL